MKHLELKFDPDGQAWLIADDGEGHHGMLSLNNILLRLPETSKICKSAMINSLAKELAKVKA